MSDNLLDLTGSDAQPTFRLAHVMFWNLVVLNYEKYRLQHFLLFVLLILYSVAGAIVFCGLESNYEDFKYEEELTQKIRRSVAAKKELVERIQALYFADSTSTSFNETDLRKIIDRYDVSMSMKPSLQRQKQWDLWGGLYYAGTIYTTIGYGDLAAATFWGRLFTIVYAFFGIPMVITILNDWGSMMFHVVNKLWKKSNCLTRPLKRFKEMLRRKRPGSQESFFESKTPSSSDDHLSGDPDAEEPIPLFLVALVLAFWMLLCCIVFLHLEDWSMFDAIYFFFVSFSTIGFGDVTLNHQVAVANFLLILIGLSVVSMAINVVQMQLEILFAKVVQSIDADFKIKLSGSTEDFKKMETQTQVDVKDVEQAQRRPSDLHMKREDDIVKQYGEGMTSGERFMMRFMSHHQRKMLEEKFEERMRMRNKWTQTAQQLKVASVQTGPQHELLPAMQELAEEEHPKSRIATRRLYIYNTGE